MVVTEFLRAGLKKRFYITCSANVFIIALASYYCLIINIPFMQGAFTAITTLPAFSWLFLLSVPLLLLCLLIIFFSLLSSRWLLKPVNYILLLCSCLVLYGTLNYGVVFDYSMIQNTFETDSQEAISYLNPQFLLFFTLFTLLPLLILVKTKVRFGPVSQEILSRSKLLLGCFALIAVIILNFYADYAATGRNNQLLKKELIPFQYLSSGYKYIRDQWLVTAEPFQILDPTPTLIAPTQTQVTVIVVGETARAANFAYQSYKRDTNRYTRPFNVTYLSNVASCGTATAVSVPCMFSLQQHENFSRSEADNQQNILDIAQQAGADVLWIDNNSGCKNACNRIETITITPDNSALCTKEPCYDEALLAPLKRKLANLSQANTVIVLHMMGSHGPTYFQRYPEQFKQFTPTCDRSDIQNCSSEQLVNTYDNTIAYSDYVNSQVLQQLAELPDSIDKNFIYVSDHGESLGENGAYLHGFPYSFAPSEQTHVPLYMWAAKNNQRINESCLRTLDLQQASSHDNIFHTLANLIGLKSSRYEASLDLLSTCKANNNKANTHHE
ncbi:phosphoethanolamine--lipid A transferase [Pseudoalteromonas sp. KG3]|uniref:Phosphoethanolamine--lipid A transferase n=1 Tax=Pseudoalteromonas prydzensis TaxID=182141 RepID=A0ABR9FKN7_9GAMM|nr:MULTISPECIES: phosphoethanolamine--lipid A transferase [Pseudoalteromonas]MBE0457357.1 phosphoethanolamine--lipid A transferase [Pseudoalteromonas prydzensis]WKD22739.1 phosphoethanolamine--lipid A transferase [Pseudoalteromonas sp. KG3]